jgi:hypothetical protein
MSGHEFIQPTGAIVLRDTDTGDRYIPVAAMLAYARRRGFTGTEPELIRHMKAIGAHWMRQTAVNPDDSAESITVDLFRLSARDALRLRAGRPS